MSDRIDLFKRELLAAALRYGERGYPVFPAEIRDGQKKPLIRIGKGADHGKHASTDPEQIRRWWARWPLAMIGLPTGKRSGVVVLDIDRKNGVDGLANLRAIGVDPFQLSPVVAQTPSGGLHFFMRYGGPLKNSAGLLAAGVDVRGDGGIVILPPSHPDPADASRFEYMWESPYGRL